MFSWLLIISRVQLIKSISNSNPDFKLSRRGLMKISPNFSSFCSTSKDSLTKKTKGKKDSHTIFWEFAVFSRLRAPKIHQELLNDSDKLKEFQKDSKHLSSRPTKGLKKILTAQYHGNQRIPRVANDSKMIPTAWVLGQRFQKIP